MTFVVMQKYVNLSRLMAVVAFSAIGLGSCGNISSPSVAQTQPANKTFGDWCRTKASLSAEANQELSSLTKLDLSNNLISDIKPLQSLTKLTALSLSGNPAPKTCPLKPESICKWGATTKS